MTNQGPNTGAPIIAVCIATFNRPRMLAACLRAVSACQPPPGTDLRLLVVDNDRAGGGRPVYEHFVAESGLAGAYVVEPERGLASARNRCLREATRIGARWLAFVDDDETPHYRWLQAHMDTIHKHRADVCAGPVLQYRDGAPLPDPAAVKPQGTGTTPRHIAAGNVMFASFLVTEQALFFDTYFNFIGGEDFDFFLRSKARGNKHVWCDEAVVFETWPAQRARLRYAFFRHFTGGINNVLRERRRRGVIRAWFRFLPRIIEKLAGGGARLLVAAVTFDKNRLREGLKRVASGIGYGAGLLNIVVERYRHSDGY